MALAIPCGINRCDSNNDHSELKRGLTPRPATDHNSQSTAHVRKEHPPMSDSRSFISKALILLFVAFGAFACKKHQVAAAPTPPPPPASTPVRAAAPTIIVRTDRPAITRGQSAMLTITTQNATSVTIEPGIGTVPLNGNRQVSPSSSVTYIATATGPGGSIGDSVRITVNDPPTPAATPIRAVTPGVANTPLTMDQQIQRAMQSVLFEFDKAEIGPDQTAKLETAAAFLKQNPNLKFLIEGHCDERGSEEYNLALGDRRANAVKQSLVRLGISESRFTTVSYGEEKPLCREQTDACYQRNRRAAYSRTN
jgi:peptidoglycan-associated lipoprotein